ncbi:MAG: hypothetical protein VXW11_07080, partial [Pseudomonadota bacterium]|nr:hypothetical protein [Pseudomonadota bacterium]
MQHAEHTQRPKARLAVIGAGLVGKKHIALIRQSPVCRLVCIVDPDEGARRLAEQLAHGEQPAWIGYIGDTVADVHTVVNARQQRPDLPWQSLAVAP